MDPQMHAEPIRSKLIDDPEYAELVSEFISHIPSRVSAIRRSLVDSDSNLLFTLIHQLKGACGSYGFHEITPVAASLEIRIRSGADTCSLANEIVSFTETCLRMTADPT